MTIRPFAIAASAALLGLGLAAGSVSAQTSTTMMKKPDAMKADAMKPSSMKMGSTKDDCMHKAAMQKNSMKKSEMMKHCDMMK